MHAYYLWWPWCMMSQWLRSIIDFHHIPDGITRKIIKHLAGRCGSVGRVVDSAIRIQASRSFVFTFNCMEQSKIKKNLFKTLSRIFILNIVLITAYLYQRLRGQWLTVWLQNSKEAIISKKCYDSVQLCSCLIRR